MCDKKPCPDACMSGGVSSSTEGEKCEDAWSCLGGYEAIHEPDYLFSLEVPFRWLVCSTWVSDLVPGWVIYESLGLEWFLSFVGATWYFSFMACRDPLFP